MATFKRGRDDINGRFLTVRQAQIRKSTADVETYHTGKKGPRD